MSTLASLLWKAQTMVGGYEDEVGDLLDEHLSSWDDFTTDPTDASIEIYAPGCPELSAVAGAELLRSLHEAGFMIGWLHYHGMETRWTGGHHCQCPLLGPAES